ncbi:MAG: hypothetical protein ACM34D_08400, partial [Gemmatimonadota bacterium]
MCSRPGAPVRGGRLTAALWAALLAALVVPVLATVPAPVAAQEARPAPVPALPPLPASAGWGVHVLTAARDPGGSIWLGTYGHGLLRLAPGAREWKVLRHDSSAS